MFQRPSFIGKYSRAISRENSCNGVRRAAEAWFMERRFGFRLFLALVWYSVLGLVSSVPLLGCAGNRAVAPVTVNVSNAPELLQQARELSNRGESHRAEQYYLAALDAGGSVEEIYPELIEVCIRGGRLGRAAVHVEARMRQVPHDLRLVRLAISLREALRHRVEARELAARLAASESKSHAEELFLGGYYERWGEPERALLHYRAYLKQTEEASRPAWVEGAVRRLEALETAQLSRRQPGLADQEEK